MKREKYVTFQRESEQYSGKYMQSTIDELFHQGYPTAVTYVDRLCPRVVITAPWVRVYGKPQNFSLFHMYYSA